MTWFRQWSIAAKMFVALTVILMVGFFGGCLGGTGIAGDEAVRIARAEIDFVPQHTNAELGRKGFPPTAVWGVTFWIEAEGTDGGFERRTVVEIHSDTGTVIAVHHNP